MNKILTVITAFFMTSAFSVRHEFNVFIGPFNASHSSFEYSLDKKNYALQSEVKTFGLFDIVYPFKSNYSTTGRIEKNVFITSSYSYSSKSMFTRRSKELVYDNKGNALYSITTKNDREKKKNIKQHIDNKDTTDLQTVFAEMAEQYNRLKFCDSTMEVFDGKRRFNVIFKDEGSEELTINEDLKFEGKASKCSMYIDKLKSTGDDLLWEVTSDEPIYFWILEDKTTKAPFIAKIEINDTPLGKLNAYTTKVTIK